MFSYNGTKRTKIYFRCWKKFIMSNYSFKIYLLRLWLSEGNKNRLPWIVSYCGLNTLLSNESDRWVAWIILGKWLQHLKSYRISADVTFNSLTLYTCRGWFRKKYTNLWNSSFKECRSSSYTNFLPILELKTNSTISTDRLLTTIKLRVSTLLIYWK